MEKRLSDAQSKAERVPALEIEKKGLVEKEQHYRQQIDLVKKELEAAQERELDMQTKLRDVEGKMAQGGGSPGNGGIRDSIKRTSVVNSHQSRNNRTAQYFMKIASTSMLGKKSGNQGASDSQPFSRSSTIT